MSVLNIAHYGFGHHIDTHKKSGLNRSNSLLWLMKCRNSLEEAKYNVLMQSNSNQTLSFSVSLSRPDIRHRLHETTHQKKPLAAL